MGDIQRSALASIPGLLITLWLGLLPCPAAAQFLCTAGNRDGLQCESDDDCPDGACIIPLGVCTQGESNGFPCICPGAQCTAEPMCLDESSLGTCNGGVFQDLCCDPADNCFDGSPCIATQRLCGSGEFKGFPCTEDRQCDGGGRCVSSGGFCNGGDFDSFSCIDDRDCPDAACVFPGRRPTPSPAPTPCVGDCSGDHSVTVDEILIGVNLILRSAALSSCGIFDADGNAEVTIDELLRAIQSLLHGCN